MVVIVLYSYVSQMEIISLCMATNDEDTRT